MSRPAPEVDFPPRPVAVATVLLGTVLCGWCLQTILGEQALAANFLSRSSWLAWVEWFGARPAQTETGQLFADGDLMSVLLGTCALSAVLWCGGTALVSTPSESYMARLHRWGFYGWVWWFVPGVCGLVVLFAPLTGSSGLLATAATCLPYSFIIGFAGWSATFCSLVRRRPASTSADTAPLSHQSRANVVLGVAIGLFVVVFTLLNWQLYWNLLIPHGDSAMYEEHLWNLLHGKGFRSYLDQGLFLGEHIQFIHVLLLPLYLVWPSHLLLEACESLVIAAAAWPIFRIAVRATKSQGIAAALAVAYLLYPPTQFLDIAIDLKTFRPIAFGLAPLLCGIDAMERGRYGRMAAWFALTLTAKEDFAVVLACLGAWVLATSWYNRRRAMRGTATSTSSAVEPVSRTGMIVGGLLMVGGAAYLLLATRVLIPFFRHGEEVHYVRYFSRFGETPGEIVWTMLTDPGLLMGELVTVNTMGYALALLVPLGLLPLLSPGRLAVALPLFTLLSLNEIATDPRHHFHAPLVPLLFWSAAHGLAAVMARWPVLDRTALSAWTVSAALGGSVLFGISPVSLTFWDAGSNWYWRRLYVVSERAEMFAKVIAKIPRDRRVASTDFVHPRFTHHDRSYDYSNYVRKVSGYELTVPEDTDLIVIDTRHPYSEIQSPDQVREYREHPDRWKVWPDETDGYFIVLERVKGL